MDYHPRLRRFIGSVLTAWRFDFSSAAPAIHLARWIQQDGLCRSSKRRPRSSCAQILIEREVRSCDWSAPDAAPSSCRVFRSARQTDPRFGPRRFCWQPYGFKRGRKSQQRPPSAKFAAAPAGIACAPLRTSRPPPIDHECCRWTCMGIRGRSFQRCKAGAHGSAGEDRAISTGLVRDTSGNAAFRSLEEADFSEYVIGRRPREAIVNEEFVRRT